MSGHLAIFAGHNLTSFLTIQRLRPFLSEAGWGVTIFKTPSSAAARANTPALKHYGFYESDLLELASDTSTWIPVESTDDKAVRAVFERPDFKGALSLRNYMIFKPAFISWAKERGFLWNLHTGLLPEYQGVFLPFWCLLENQKAHGCSLHEIDAGIDTGHLIDTYEAPLDKTKPVIQAYTDLIDGGADMIATALQTYADNGTIATRVQDGTHARYYTFPTEADIARGREQGIRLWGTPLETLRLYRDLFGTNEELTMRLVNAIAEFEHIPQTEMERVATTTVSAA